MAVATYTKSGNKAATAARLDKNIFGVDVTSHELLKQAYVSYLANGRTSAGRTKTRGMVSGGGKKPWRQKGTGRARFGSSRNPIWRGGGIVFGPSGNENYSRQLNTKAKRQALRQALSLAADSGKIIVLEGFDPKAVKTAEVSKLLDKIGSSKNVLIVTDNKTPELERATRNLPHTRLISARYLTVYDALNADSIILTEAALQVVSDWLGAGKPAPAAGLSND